MSYLKDILTCQIFVSMFKYSGGYNVQTKSSSNNFQSGGYLSLLLWRADAKNWNRSQDILFHCLHSSTQHRNGSSSHHCTEKGDSWGTWWAHSCEREDVTEITGRVGTASSQATWRPKSSNYFPHFAFCQLISLPQMWDISRKTVVTAHQHLKKRFTNRFANKMRTRSRFNDNIVHPYAQSLQEETNKLLQPSEPRMFAFSNGWILRFQQKFHVEFGSVNIANVEVALPSLLLLMLQYALADVCNAEEFGLFSRLPPG